MTNRRAPRALLLFALTIGTIVSIATPASALSLTPTDWRSTVDAITPSTDTITVELFTGGEAIRVTAAPGHEVIVPGYAREPYLRIAVDGTTSVNVRSPAVAMNSTATGTSTSVTADAKAEPEWQELGATGWVQWHDHRIHRMPGVASPTSWNLPVIVDGQVVAVSGTLVELPPPAMAGRLLLAFVLVVLGGGLALLPTRRRSDSDAAAVGAVVGAAIASWSSAMVWISTPAGFDHPVPLVALSGLALVAALTALQPSYVRLVATLVSVAALCGWVAIQWTVLTSSFVPPSGAANPRGALIPLVAGIALGSAGLAVRGAGVQAEAAPDSV